MPTLIALVACAALLTSACADDQPAESGPVSAGRAVADSTPHPQPQAAPTASQADAVRVRGVVYLAYESQYIDGKHVGALVDTTQRQLGNGTAPAPAVADGTATFLPVGTDIHSLTTSRTEFRVAAKTDAGWKIYENYWALGARTGGELLDIGGKVVRIDVLSHMDFTTVLGSVTDRDAVRDLVAQVVAGPVARAQDFTPEAAIGFLLADGTTVRRGYSGESLRVGDVAVPRSFVAAIDAAWKRG